MKNSSIGDMLRANDWWRHLHELCFKHDNLTPTFMDDGIVIYRTGIGKTGNHRQGYEADLQSLYTFAVITIDDNMLHLTIDCEGDKTTRYSLADPDLFKDVRSRFLSEAAKLPCL
jgi:hypothetical protein